MSTHQHLSFVTASSSDLTATALGVKVIRIGHEVTAILSNIIAMIHIIRFRPLRGFFSFRSVHITETAFTEIS